MHHGIRKQAEAGSNFRGRGSHGTRNVDGSLGVADSLVVQMKVDEGQGDVSKTCGESVTTDDLPRFTERFAYFPGGLTLKRLDEWGTSLIGSPETVVKKAREIIETARPDSLVGMFSFGGLSHAQVTHSIELFATQVMPRLAAEPLG